MDADPRLVALEAEVAALKKQLHVMRKLFFQDRRQPRVHSEMRSSMAEKWNFPYEHRYEDDD